MRVALDTNRVSLVEGDSIPYFYVARGVGRVGVWPGLGSDEWIEVVW